ncbi:MAG TPA: hypothetical protein VL308_14355 [Gemmatimonadaceae bacterium]|jgi:hypothetical protein|nr:hypothetical protein [Gemmatimonadaceae bacterium]
MPLVRRIGTLAITGALLFVAACSNDDNAPTAPTTATVAGTYKATRFVVTSPLGTEDVLQEGGSVTTTFAADGTVTGHVTVPSQAVDEDFAGTWKLQNGQVEIEDVPSDSFVEDVSFKPVGKTLVGDETFSGVRVELTLTKQ